VRATEEYVLYKTSKAEALKNYHLAYYYHLQDKSLLATKVLQSAILTAKQYSSDIYALLGRIYYENNEPLKAEEFASRAYREDKHNYLAALTLADISYDSRHYENSLMYYKKAKKLTKNAAPQVGIAKSYLALEQPDKAKKMYEKMLKTNKFNEDLLVESLKVIPQRVDYYLPRVASIDLANNDIWLGLAKYAIKDGNYTMATTYLNNSYYIDENNFKYYYYLSLLLRAKGDDELADLSLLRCADINAEYEAAVKSGYSEYYGK
jgi:tetratricopeptide (TPR) repeat protein